MNSLNQLNQKQTVFAKETKALVNCQCWHILLTRTSCGCANNDCCPAEGKALTVWHYRAAKSFPNFNQQVFKFSCRAENSHKNIIFVTVTCILEDTDKHCCLANGGNRSEKGNDKQPILLFSSEDFICFLPTGFHLHAKPLHAAVKVSTMQNVQLRTFTWAAVCVNVRWIHPVTCLSTSVKSIGSPWRL